MDISLTVTIALITAIAGPIIVEWVKIKLRKQPKLEDPLQKECDQALIIESELEDIRKDLVGDRAWVVMFHNGGHFLHTNKSIQKFSIMYEVAKPGVSMVAHTFTNIPISLFAKSTDEILKNGLIFIPNFNDPTIATFGLKQGASVGGTLASYIIGLFDIKTEACVGMVGIDYMKPKKLTMDQKSILIERSNRLAGYLSTFLSS